MVTIANIEAADMKQLAALGEELTGKKPHMQQLKIILDKICNDPNYILIGAKNEQGQLLGSVMGILCLDIVGQCQPFMVLENLIISRNSRRQGVAKQLVGYLEDCAREKNVILLCLLLWRRGRRPMHSTSPSGMPRVWFKGLKSIYNICGTINGYSQHQSLFWGAILTNSAIALVIYLFCLL